MNLYALLGIVNPLLFILILFALTDLLSTHSTIALATLIWTFSFLAIWSFRKQDKAKVRYGIAPTTRKMRWAPWNESWHELALQCLLSILFALCVMLVLMVMASITMADRSYTSDNEADSLMTSIGSLMSLRTERGNDSTIVATGKCNNTNLAVNGLLHHEGMVLAAWHGSMFAACRIMTSSTTTFTETHVFDLKTVWRDKGQRLVNLVAESDQRTRRQFEWYIHYLPDMCKDKESKLGSKYRFADAEEARQTAHGFANKTAIPLYSYLESLLELDKKISEAMGSTEETFANLWMDYRKTTRKEDAALFLFNAKRRAVVQWSPMVDLRNSVKHKPTVVKMFLIAWIRVIEGTRPLFNMCRRTLFPNPTPEEVLMLSIQHITNLTSTNENVLQAMRNLAQQAKQAQMGIRIERGSIIFHHNKMIDVPWQVERLLAVEKVLESATPFLDTRVLQDEVISKLERVESDLLDTEMPPTTMKMPRVEVKNALDKILTERFGTEGG